MMALSRRSSSRIRLRSVPLRTSRCGRLGIDGAPIGHRHPQPPPSTSGLVDHRTGLVLPAPGEMHRLEAGICRCRHRASRPSTHPPLGQRKRAHHSDEPLGAGTGRRCRRLRIGPANGPQSACCWLMASSVNCPAPSPRPGRPIWTGTRRIARCAVAAHQAALHVDVAPARRGCRHYHPPTGRHLEGSRVPTAFRGHGQIQPHALQVGVQRQLKLNGCSRAGSAPRVPDRIAAPLEHLGPVCPGAGGSCPSPPGTWVGLIAVGQLPP